MARTRPDATADRLAALCRQHLRAPDGYATDDVTGNPLLDFTPALTVAEQATLADLTTMARFGITANITLAEFQAIKPDLVTARQYVALASPTNAQSVAAIKAVIRVLGALLRE